MKKTAIFFLLIGITVIVKSQQMTISWIAQAGGPDWDIVTDIIELPDKQIIMTGSFYDKILFGGDTLYSNGERDIFIASYNVNGVLNKVVSLGGSGYDYVRVIQSAGKSGFILPIQFNNKLIVGTKMFEGISSNNFLISLFDRDINLISHAQIGCNGELDITNIEIASDNDLYFSGWFTDSLKVEDSIYVAKDGKDMFLGKISMQGKLKWVKQFGGDGHDMLSSFVSEKEDFNYITGITRTGCFGSKMAPSDITKGMKHLFLSLIKNNGEIYSVFYPLKGLQIEPVGMLKDENFVWLVANFQHSAFINGVELLSYGNSDVVIIKIDINDGSVSYCQLGGTGKDQAIGLVKSGNSIVIAGLFTDKIPFATQEIIADNYGTDIFIASVNTNCLPENIWSIHGDKNEFPCSIFASGTGIYIAGEFSGNLKSNKFELMSSGNEDIFLARIENCIARDPLNISVTQKDNTHPLIYWELDAGKGYVSYLWNDGASLSRYLTVFKSDEYSVTITDSLGCTYTKKINVSPQKSVNINKTNEIIPEQKFRLYPSVTSNFIYWEPASAWIKNKAMVRIYDPLGRISSVSEIKELTATVYWIDFATYSEGAYLVEVSGEGFREVSKVIIKK